MVGNGQVRDLRENTEKMEIRTVVIEDLRLAIVEVKVAIGLVGVVKIVGENRKMTQDDHVDHDS